jgi:uncharacterized membrane protein YqjE
MIALAITGAVTLVCLAALAASWRSSKAIALTLFAATETAFTRDAIPQAARDAALDYLKSRDAK